MKYQCLNCKKQFMQPSKLNVYAEDTQNTNIPPISALVIPTLDSYVCPFCKSKNYDELTEKPQENPALEDMQQVPFEQVKDYLAKGYHELDRKDHVFSKGLVMIKLREEKT